MRGADGARRWLARAALIAGLASAARAQAQRVAEPVRSREPPHALFALIIGVNASPGGDVAPLRYADDDAARYLDLFRALGARAYVLTRVDANTRALHPQAAAESLPPRRAELQQTVKRLAYDVAQARGQGVQSTLYLVYAGHGESDGETLSLTLEDGRLTEAELMTNVVADIAAGESHVIVDACNAYLLALPRGAGGTRRPLAGFVERQAAMQAGRVGLLLSSSGSGESHEWAGFEAGVFSHEVRSGLYGAADVDGDGRVTYAEIGAFVARANETVTNERYRPRVLARPPRGSELLVDLRPRATYQLRFEGPDGAAHFMLENGDGVRLLDFHGNGNVPVQLLRPVGEGPLYLRRLSDGAERVVPRVDGVVQLQSLPVTAAHAASRGAAQHAFGRLFARQFDVGAVVSWARASREAEASFEIETAWQHEERALRVRRAAGIGAVGVGVAAGIAAVWLAQSARALQQEGVAAANQRDAAAINDRIEQRNRIVTGIAIGAAAAGTVGALLLLWPARAARAPGWQARLSVQGTAVTARWSF